MIISIRDFTECIIGLFMKALLKKLVKLGKKCQEMLSKLIAVFTTSLLMGLKKKILKMKSLMTPHTKSMNLRKTRLPMKRFIT